MRRAPTDAERKLWQLLRSLKPLGLHFRRQAPIGIYIADFAWHAGKLVVELDGSQHAAAHKNPTSDPSPRGGGERTAASGKDMR